MSQSETKKQPSHAVYIVEGEGRSSYWTKIGSAWPHEDGDGFNITLACIPLNGRLVIRKPKPKKEDTPERGR